MPGFDELHVLMMAALASSDGGQDPVDVAIHSRRLNAKSILPRRNYSVSCLSIPARKMSEATVADPILGTIRVIKGAFAAVSVLAAPSPTGTAAANELEAKGFRVLAVAAGPAAAMQMLGLIALSDLAREDSATLVTELKRSASAR